MAHILTSLPDYRLTVSLYYIKFCSFSEYDILSNVTIDIYKIMKSI